MAVYNKLGRLMPAASSALLFFIWIAAAGEAQGQTLYEYIGKDGTVIITDHPPPGVNAKKVESLPEPREEQKALDKEADEKMQNYREAEKKRKEREETIRDAREELEKAKRDEQNYRSNMNQSANYSQRHHWRVLVDEQLKLIEEKQKKLDELESSP